MEKPIAQLNAPLPLGEEDPGDDSIAGEIAIDWPWATFTIFYGGFPYADELIPLEKVGSGLEGISRKTGDWGGVLEWMGVG